MVSSATAGRTEAAPANATNTQQTHRNSDVICPPGRPVGPLNYWGNSRHPKRGESTASLRACLPRLLFRPIGFVAGAALLAQRLGVGRDRIGIGGLGIRRQ